MSNTAFIKDLMDRVDEIMYLMQNHSSDEFGFFDVPQDLTNQLREELESLLDE